MPDTHKVSIDILGDNTLSGSFMMTPEQIGFLRYVFKNLKADGKWVPWVIIRDLTEEEEIDRAEAEYDAKMEREKKAKERQLAREEERKRRKAEAERRAADTRSVWQAAFDKANAEKAAKEARRSKNCVKKE